jgi:hypothetical protein
MRVSIGSVLVATLLTCLALWALLGAVLLLATVQYRVALATRDHAVAASVLQEQLDLMRSWPASDWPAAGDGAAGARAECAWSYRVLEGGPRLLRVRITATVGRAVLTRDATLHGG